MFRVILGILASVAVVGVLLVAFARPLDRTIDARANAVASSSPRDPASQAVETHRRLWIADLHCDAAFWDRDLVARSERGHVDLPRLREGNVALQVFSFPNAYPLASNYRRTPALLDIVGVAALARRWPRSTWYSPVARARHQASIVYDAARESEGRLVVITGVRDLTGIGAASSNSARTVGAILAVEGLHIARGDVEAVDDLFASGVRVFGLAHMSDNSVTGSAHGWRKHGLTDFGRRVVARIDSLGGIVDLAHASETTVDEVLAMPSVAVMVSHTGVDGTCPGERNLSDHQLAGIAAHDGVIGIGFWRGAVCGDDAAAIARAMRHAVGVAGIDAVALGSDFDGAVRTPFDAAGMVYMTEALLAEGFDASEIARIMGLNVLEFFLRSLPPEG
jgi:microsomal dipeptidase-like Zn-dependent dipeptidase